MARIRLPDRRPNETVDLEFDGARYSVTVGFDPAGQPGEVFAHGAKVGSAMDLLIDDGAVLVSLLFQHGVAPGDLAHSLGRIDGTAPASILGALVAAAAGGEG
jgi:hypothetical protein